MGSLHQEGGPMDGQDEHVEPVVEELPQYALMVDLPD
jgi:hypothetical protein